MSNKIKTKSFKAQLKAAKLPEKSVPICLRGDLQARFGELEAELEAVQAQPTSGRLNAPTAARAVALAQQITEIAQEMREETVQITLRAMPSEDWDLLCADHPAEDDNKDDATLGLHGQTFWPALLRASIVSPEMDDDDWDTLLGRPADPDKPDDMGVKSVLTKRQWIDLSNDAWGLNQRTISVPFSRTASAVLALSANESKRLND